MLADLKFAARQLAKAPGVTIIAVLALALGIATATTMFTFFDALLLRPVPFLKDESTLLTLRAVDAKDPARDMEFSIPDFNDVRKEAKTLSGALTLWDRTYIIGSGADPERVLGSWITVDGFQTLGVQPMLGRLFRPEEAQLETPNVAILGYNVWAKSFGRRRDIIGATITLNQAPVTVIGVMPPGFRFPDVSDIWQPFPDQQYIEEKHRGMHGWPVFARIKPGYTREQVQAELDTLAARQAAAHPNTNTGISYRTLLAREQATRDISLAMRLMLGAVIAVLLIACSNVANLLLARASTRSREIAIRAALGAGRGRIVRQVLTESLLLGTIGGVAGVVLATWELDLILGLIPIEMPYWLRFDIDGRIAAFVVAVTVGTSILFGLFPAWQISRPNLAQELKEGGRTGTATLHARRTRSALVVFQMALALVLLVVAALTMRSFLNLQRTDTGIDPQHVLTFRTGIPPTMAKQESVAYEFMDRVVKQLRTVPGVEDAGFITYLPVSEATNLMSFQIEGRPDPASATQLPHAITRAATPGVFGAFRIPLVSGRLFNDGDSADAPEVAVIDQNFAHRFFPAGDALGKRISFDEPGPKRKWVTIVGVVGTVRQHPADADEDGAVWQPLAQQPDNFASAVVRVRGEPAAYLRAIRAAVRNVRADIPIYYVDPMTRVVGKTLWKPHFFGALFAGFAAIALFLAAIGIYGVMAYSVSQRTQEIGVRMALGAQPGVVVRMVLTEGARLVASGVALGFVAAWAVTQLLTGMLHGVDPHDPPTFAAVPVLLAGVALLACYVPGRRATLVDPLAALRTE